MMSECYSCVRCNELVLNTKAKNSQEQPRTAKECMGMQSALEVGQVDLGVTASSLGNPGFRIKWSSQAKLPRMC